MRDLLRILISPLIWLAAFTGVYGLHGLICGHGIGGTVLGAISLPRGLLALAYLCAMALQVVVLRGLYLPRLASSSAFVGSVSRTTGWVGLVATFWTLLPSVTTTLCP